MKRWLTAIAPLCLTSGATALAQTELQPGTQTIAPRTYGLHTAGQYVQTVQQPSNTFRGGAPPNLPGIIIGSNYDLGGEGVGFHEPVIGSRNAASYRSDGGSNLKLNTDNTAAAVGCLDTIAPVRAQANFLYKTNSSGGNLTINGLVYGIFPSTSGFGAAPQVVGLTIQHNTLTNARLTNFPERCNHS